jgi:hypothetical protein
MTRASTDALLYEPHVDVVATPPVCAPSAAARLETWLRKEGLLVGLVAVVTGISLARLANEVTQDTWLSLLAGRTVAHSGLHHASLTWWSQGKPWIDQQWLAHLFFYSIYSAGGLVLVCLAGVIAAGVALACAIAYSRRRGATARSVAWLVAVSALPFFVGAGNIRTQILVLPLFVTVVSLLLRDQREPSRRVFLVIPILVLWANLHGSVLVAAALVALSAAFGFRKAGMARRSTALGASAILACLATPYGLDIFGYYRGTLLNPSFHAFVSEWRPLALGVRTAPIMLLGGVSVWLVARHVRRLGMFTVVAQLLLVVLAFAAVRNAVWLGLGSVMLLAPALDAELGRRELSNLRINFMIGVMGAAFALIAATAVVSRGTQALAASFPVRAGDVVAREAGPNAKSRIFADERFADWLMFEHPALVGRLAYDASFEQLTSKQVLAIIEWKNRISGRWSAAVRGAKVVVVSLPAGKNVARAYRHEPALRERYADSRIAIFVRR